MTEIAVEKVTDNPQQPLAELVEEAAAQGSNSLRRLVADWLSGSARFDGPGEGLFVALKNGRVVGVCGLDLDPASADRTVGRLRDTYVSATHRRGNIGRVLVGAVIEEARKTFKSLKLRADTPGAAAFFSALGFEPTPDAPETTHRLSL
jgi:GNAT superfamily N-acetyltransferase